MKLTDHGMKTCKHCGRPITIIKWGFYHTAVVDPGPVMVRPDPDGEDYVRFDGSKIKGSPVPYESEEAAEPAYRQHRKTCGVKA